MAAQQLQRSRQIQTKLRVNFANWKDLPKPRTPELIMSKTAVSALSEKCKKRLAAHQLDNPAFESPTIVDVIDLYKLKAPKDSITRPFAELLAAIALEKSFSRGVRLAAITFLASDAIRGKTYSTPAHAVISTLGATDETIKKMQNALTETEDGYKKREKEGIKIYTATLTMMINAAVAAYTVCILDFLNKLNIYSVLPLGIVSAVITYPLLIGISKICHGISSRNWERAPEKNLEEMNGILTRIDEMLPEN